MSQEKFFFGSRWRASPWKRIQETNWRRFFPRGVVSGKIWYRRGQKRSKWERISRARFSTALEAIPWACRRKYTTEKKSHCNKKNLTSPPSLFFRPFIFFSSHKGFPGRRKNCKGIRENERGDFRRWECKDQDRIRINISRDSFTYFEAFDQRGWIFDISINIEIDYFWHNEILVFLQVIFFPTIVKEQLIGSSLSLEIVCSILKSIKKEMIINYNSYRILN